MYNLLRCITLVDVHCLLYSYVIVSLLLRIAVMGGPKGPAPNSEFEHSSIPATIKKIFNLSSNFLTHRDAWAGTFEGVVGELTSPRTDCPGIVVLSGQYMICRINWN